MERVGYVAPFESSGNYRLQIGDILFSNINSVEYIGNTAFIDNGKIGVCCYSGLAERSAEYYVNSIFYRS